MYSTLLLQLWLSFSAAVYSFHTPIRLTGGKGPYEGNVELFIEGSWKYICDDSWDIRDAKVVCRTLNYTKGLSATKRSHYPISLNASYWLDDVQCWGSEDDITYCWHRGVANHNCKHGTEIAGVVCSNVTENVKVVPDVYILNEGSPPEIRLEGETLDGFISTGYLQIKNNGVWGAVCYDNWTPLNSYVACGHLGYPDIEDTVVFSDMNDSSIASLYWMSDIECIGTESTLFECKHAGWEKHACNSGEEVYISCKRSPLLRGNRFDKVLIGNHSIRLRAGSKHSEGRVEIKHMNRWGTICDDGWNIQNANVVCRQMGFGTAFEASHNAIFGEGMGKVWFDEVSCNGSEHDIRQCQHMGYGEGDCGHKEDAGVKCHFPYGEVVQKIRIVGGPNERLGRVEVFDDDQWKGICGINWGAREAEVACRQAGLGYARRGGTSSKYGLQRRLAMYDVKCSGDELALKHCFHKEEEEGRCRYYEMAVVECSKTAPDVVMDYRELKKSIRVESRTLYDLSCAYEENCLSPTAAHYIHFPHLFERTLLRFTSRFWNRGTDAFLPRKAKGDWEWHQCHQHYHSMERFSDYDLTDENNIKQAEGHKASFCLEDSKCEKGVSKFFNCTNGGNQGVSVNCADNYKWNIDCQWIDITDLKYGKYKLRVVINPLRKIIESDYSNNVVSCQIDYISQSKVNVTDCQLDTCEQMSHGGTSDGACCKFPFTYKNIQYHACTTNGFGTTLWCATTNNFSKDKLWGKC